mgnify:CR=1 FL=1
MRTLKATLLVLFFGTVLTLSAIAYTNVGRAMPADVKAMKNTASFVSRAS